DLLAHRGKRGAVERPMDAQDARAAGRENGENALRALGSAFAHDLYPLLPSSLIGRRSVASSTRIPRLCNTAVAGSLTENESHVKLMFLAGERIGKNAYGRLFAAHGSARWSIVSMVGSSSGPFSASAPLQPRAAH